MKKSILLIACLMIMNLVFAQNNDYPKQMEQGLAVQDTAKKYETHKTNALYFAEISKIQTNEWLPAYYQAYNEMIAASSILKTKDFRTCNLHIGQAQTALDIAKERAGGTNSEILALQSFIYTGRIWEDPMTKGATYSGMVFEALEQAIAADAKNPRAYYLKGQMILFTPAFWGGGAENALPWLEKAAAAYETHAAPSAIHPAWGQKPNQQLLLNAREQIAAMNN